MTTYAPSPAPSTDTSRLTTATVERKATAEQVALFLFITIPFVAVLFAVPFAWGWGLSWVDVAISVVIYVIASHGITVGYHRFFTHGSFKAVRPLKIALAIAGSMAIEGPVVRWVADHRRHHAFSDREGDPHSPWRYGETVPALIKGLYWAHVGWLFDIEQTPRRKYAPDLMDDPDLQKVDQAFLWIVIATMLFPPLVGGLVTWSWHGAITAFFWASLVRVALLHHVTWSINSICHAMGNKPFLSRDRSGNVWWLALLSNGESWHNLHHADPTCARHGVEPGQIDSSARMIGLFERFGWASDVRWPRKERLDARRVSA